MKHVPTQYQGSLEEVKILLIQHQFQESLHATLKKSWVEFLAIEKVDACVMAAEPLEPAKKNRNDKLLRMPTGAVQLGSNSELDCPCHLL